MKIVDLCEFYSTRGGGVRSYLTRMGDSAARHGHELVVIAPGPRDEVRTQAGGKVITYAGPPMPYDPTYHWPIRLDRMRALVAAEKPDVLQVSSPFLPALVARTLDVPLRTYVHHSDPIGCYLTPLAKRHLPERLRSVALAPAWAFLRSVTRQMDATITAGAWLTEQLSEHGCERVVTVPFGIAHDAFKPDKRDPTLRAKLMGALADNPDARLLLITGRLAVDKRQDRLVEAAIRLNAKFPVTLLVLGDGPERDNLQRQASVLPQATFLPFLHDRTQYASLLASVDLLLHGSVCETFGFVIAETLLSGTPAVVPNAGAAPHMVAPGCAEVYPALASAAQVAAAAERMLRLPRDAVRSAALATAARHPTMDQHFERLFALYQRLTPRGARTPAAFVPSNA
ncbi:MAG TPA: glycosyltransferase [Polyangiales bacterium]|nr:glycosyltransferase [Polyangiales bacterium]